MKYYSYVVARDYGFAPNPFHGICTLATCKPEIRKSAQVGDWIIGCGSVSLGLGGKVVYAMKVSEVMTFNEYWEDPRFFSKRPVMNGSLKMMYGDNIYLHDGNSWHQADSHHSLEGGVINEKNLIRDTGSDRVLVSDCYYYFGEDAVEVPEELVSEVIKTGRGFKYIQDLDKAAQFIKFLENRCETGLQGLPKQFEMFKRHDGND